MPQHSLATTDESLAVPECQTPMRIFPEVRDGRMHYHRAASEARTV